MKRNISQLFRILQCLWRIIRLTSEFSIFAVLLCAVQIYAQQGQQQSSEFTIGAFGGSKYEPAMYDSFKSSGMNTMVQHADDITQPLLSGLNLIASNHEFEVGPNKHWIGYYSTSYYSKWESEQDQTDPDRVGVKHKYGKDTTWQGVRCWSTIGLNSPVDSLVYGPHYRQERRYKSWTHGSCNTCVRYTARFRMALDYNQQLVNPNEQVCVIKVVHRYAIKYSPTNYTVQDTDYRKDTLIVSDFNSDGTFKDIYFDELIENWYEYPSEFIPQEFQGKIINEYTGEEYPIYDDSNPDNGIQFWVEWLHNSTLCTLYIDYAEVYDNDGWNNYVDDPDKVKDSIQAYTQRYSTWDNIIYWYGHDEPWTIDAFTPMYIVDSLVREVGGAPLITEFYPYWTWFNTINGDTLIRQFVEIAKPEKLMIDIYPFGKTPSVPEELDVLHQRFQEAHLLQPDFWYVGQGYGLKTAGGNWCIWRKPDSTELKASVMLALAHGCKGIMFWKFESAVTSYPGPGCLGTYFDCIVDEEFNPTELFYVIKNNFAPRLKGKLGSTLLRSDYKGNYLQLKYTQPTQPVPVTWDYLTLGLGQPAEDMNWHAGFLKDKSHTDNNYFLLANLWTIAPKSINVKVTEPVSGYENYSFRNVESGYLDTTFTGEITTQLTQPAGEGYLYQVAPVVLYGGRLLYPESVGEGQVLWDDMTIENGATLTVYDTYTCKANIIIKDGSIVNGIDGKIIFEDGKRLIIEGTATVNGIPSDKLEFEFLSEEEAANGIVINENGTLTITNCKIMYAETGIRALVNSRGVNVQYVDFNDCVISSIAFLGEIGGPEVVRKVKYCTITNSPWGISASNLPELLIQGNTITSTNLAINLSNVSRAIVFGNNITSNTGSLPAIFAESTGGEIHSNFIDGHITGLSFGNSAIDVGGNHITDCLYHAMYAGSGSEINMQGRLINIPNSHLWYAISGYNDFYDNGGYEGSGNDNDGSEIYIKENSNVNMIEGCNSVVDDREPSGNLVNTLLLMNGDNVIPPIHVEAQHNYWGETEVTSERFGDLDVNFDEYLSGPCPWPVGGGEDMLVVQTSSGEVVDTLYPAGEFTGTLSETEMLYAAAEKSYITGEYAASENYYDQIIMVDTVLSVKKEAYARKYEIGKLLGKDTAYFNDLRNVYLSLAQSSTNPLLEKTFYQLSRLCLIGEEEFIPAIGEFDEIIQQNPNTEEAVYAEIDAITTALLVEGDSTLGKGTLGKYLIKTGEDYLSKLDGILKKHFGSENGETEEEQIPKEYTLHQNYPNPFNPSTIIKYELPKISEVSLIIYDILGRKVKELVNTNQQAGRYEIKFDASNLASGVYIYQLRTVDYVNAKKMILLK